MAEVSAREQMIFDLASMEWELFQLVHNTGGRASCQDDPDTFFKMRMSQWMVYSDGVLKSCMEDFQEAAAQGRNLIFEKYGRMMETTHPEEYERVRQYFPEISEKHRENVEKITAIHLGWDKKTAEAYPYLRKNGRLATTREDSADRISHGKLSERRAAVLFRENGGADIGGNRGSGEGRCQSAGADDRERSPFLRI